MGCGYWYVICRGGWDGVPSFYPCPTSARRSWAERTDGLRGGRASQSVSLGKSAEALAQPQPLAILLVLRAMWYYSVHEVCRLGYKWKGETGETGEMGRLGTGPRGDEGMRGDVLYLTFITTPRSLYHMSDLHFPLYMQFSLIEPRTQSLSNHCCHCCNNQKLCGDVGGGSSVLRSFILYRVAYPTLVPIYL